MFHIYITNDLSNPPDHRYLPELIPDGVRSQVNNPEVDVDVHRSNAVLDQQLLQLKLITTKLKNAYNGLDVDWIDNGK